MFLIDKYRTKMNWQLFAASALLSLNGCENIVDKTAVSINSNAYYTVYQDEVGGSWQTKLTSYANSNYRPISVSFTVPAASSPYAVAFVCPSASGIKPHEVFAFYATPAELDVMDFNCKRATQDILLRPLYGEIKGINLPTLSSTQGEQAHIALSRDTAINGWEAYATMVRAGSRDVVAYKGVQQGGAIEPKKFYVKRNVALGATEDPQRVDVDFSGEDQSAYLVDFNPNQLSTVTINGVAASEAVESSVGFLTDNKSYLSLAASNTANYSFYPVPLKLFSGATPGFTNRDEFNPGEGHELIVQVSDVDGKPLRKAYKFFTNSEAVNHVMTLPQAVASQPVLGLRNKGELLQVILNWSAYRDDAAGKTQIYRWYLRGQTSDPLEKYPATLNVSEADWIIHVTPGWLNAVNGSTQNYSLVLPTDFKVNVKDAKGEEVYTWRQEWGMKATSSVDWEFAAVVVNDKFSAKDVVEYYLNRNFNILSKEGNGVYKPQDFVFGESFVRATSTPSS